MSLKDYKNKLRSTLLRLKLVHLYPDHFLEELGGRRALENYIDDALDEISELRKIIKKIEKNKG